MVLRTSIVYMVYMINEWMDEDVLCLHYTIKAIHTVGVVV